MSNCTPEWLFLLTCFIVFTQGFMTAGVMYAHGKFWNGVRDVYSLGFRHWRKK